MLSKSCFDLMLQVNWAIKSAYVNDSKGVASLIFLSKDNRKKKRLWHCWMWFIAVWTFGTEALLQGVTWSLGNTGKAFNPPDCGFVLLFFYYSFPKQSHVTKELECYQEYAKWAGWAAVCQLCSEMGCREEIQS